MKLEKKHVYYIVIVLQFVMRFRLTGVLVHQLFLPFLRQVNPL